MSLENNETQELIKLQNDIASGNFYSISLETLSKHAESLLNQPNNPITPTKLLDISLRASTNEYNISTQQYSSNQDKIKLQSELIKTAFDKGAKINDFMHISSLDTLYHNIFLLDSITKDQANRAFYDSCDTEECIEKKVELVEIMYEKFLSSSKDIALSLGLKTIKILAERDILNNKYTLKLALNHHSDFHRPYSPDELKAQTEIINSLLAKGTKLEDLSFEDLNIKNNDVSILKILLEYGLDPRALALHNFTRPDALQVLNLMSEYNVKPKIFNLLIQFCNYKTFNLENFKLLITNLDYSINDNFTVTEIVNDFIHQGEKFRDFFDSILNDYLITNDKKHIKDLLSFDGSLLHLLVATDKLELVKFILENYECNINIQNNPGQTPLFFAKTTEMADVLIGNNADLSIKDNKGNTWLNKPSLKIIEHAMQNNYFSEESAAQAARYHLTKGNYEHAAKLAKIGFSLDLDQTNEMVNAIILGLKNSIENNKYQALLNLADKAGIEIPEQFKYLLDSYKDDHKPEEFDFLYGLMHKLANHYLNVAKSNFVTALEIDNKFDAYYQVFGKALNLLDNDFTLEVLNINGLRPDTFERDTTVYRGMRLQLSEEDIDLYFKYGHRAFSNGEQQKALGFYANQPWNKAKEDLEYGGTYTALSPKEASYFARDSGILLEIKAPTNSFKLCGSAWDSEIILSSISGNDIIAIYTMNSYKILNVYKNPYIDILPSFKSGDSNFDIEYDDLGCKDLPKIYDYNLLGKSALYQDYDDFIERYTPQDYATDKLQLTADYFTGRDLYVENYYYGLQGICNLSLECCLTY